MLSALVISLKAVRDCRYDHFTGRGAHGFWMKSWEALNPGVGAWLHGREAAEEGSAPSTLKPFTLSPLMDLPLFHSGYQEIPAGSLSWLRVTSLHARLTDALQAGSHSWLENLPGRISIDGAEWELIGSATEPQQNPWAGSQSYEDLRHAALDSRRPPQRWTVRFTTPTCITGKLTALLFPIPDRVLDSWRRAWNVFAPFEISEELCQQARETLHAVRYELRTHSLKSHYSANPNEAYLSGYSGEVSFESFGFEAERAYEDLLFRFSFFRGTGSHTTQGFGQTRPVEGR